MEIMISIILLILVKYANLSEGEYQIEDVSFNIKSSKYFSRTMDSSLAIGFMVSLGHNPM